MSKENVKFIMSEFGYSLEAAEEITKKLEISHPIVIRAFYMLIHGENIDNIEANGYSIGDLIKEYKMTPIAALLTLDWLIREPEIALKALSEGYDSLK